MSHAAISKHDPMEVASYLEYRRRAIEFVKARGQRIADLGI